MLKIFIINPTYQYVYECIVKIVYYSYEDGNKKFNHHHFSQRFSIRQNFPGLIYFYNWSGLDIYAGFESRGSWFPLSTDNIFEIIHKLQPQDVVFIINSDKGKFEKVYDIDRVHDYNEDLKSFMVTGPPKYVSDISRWRNL